MGDGACASPDAFAIAHVRLANLYPRTGKPELSSNQMDAAWQARSQIGVRVRGITNRDDLTRSIQEKDRKGIWVANNRLTKVARQAAPTGRKKDKVFNASIANPR